MCAMQGYYTLTDTMPGDFSVSRKKSLGNALDKLEEELLDGSYAALIARLGETGALTKQLVLDTLSIS